LESLTAANKKDKDGDVAMSSSEAAMETENRLLPDLSLLASSSPLVASIYAERANCYLRLGDFLATLKDCAKSIYLKDDCIEAHITKAIALRGLNRHDEALREMTVLMEKGWGGRDARIRHAYETAEFEARKAKRPDYYAVLGCRSIATDKEIKTAYYQRSKEHHPDRHVKADDAEKQKHDTAFKLVSEALEILDDPPKRKLYDEGYDKAAIEERIQAAERAAHRQGHRGNQGGGGHHHHH